MNDEEQIITDLKFVINNLNSLFIKAQVRKNIYAGSYYEREDDTLSFLNMSTK